MKSFFAMIGLMGLGIVGLAGDVKPVEITLEDQFGAKQTLVPHRGKVIVLVYGDRKATDDCKTIGETIHVAFHPKAKGLAPKDAQKAEVASLPNLPAGTASPDVMVVPVACTGKVPDLVKSMLQGQIKKASPDVPVWLDCMDTMTKTFGMTTGQVNFVVIDAQGRARHLVNGTPDQKKLQDAAQIIQDLRVEALKK